MDHTVVFRPFVHRSQTADAETNDLFRNLARFLKDDINVCF